MSTQLASETRKADLTRLHDFFEKLKSHRVPRNLKSTILEDVPMEDVRPAPTPALTLADLDPAMKKLSNIVDRSTTSTRPRRNTVASIIAAQGGKNDMPVDEINHSEDEKAESSTKFPVEEGEKKEFPFTFKHMVHKLYEKEDWARAVKEELEKSQNEFKPLAEQMKTRVAGTEEMEDEGAEGGKVEDGVVRFKIAATSPGAGRRGSAVGHRQRSQSIAVAATNKGYTPLSPGVRSPTVRPPTVRSSVKSPAVKSPGAESKPDLRVVKKRCVGRRKSASGSLNPEANKPTWVYNSAVSVSERPVATTFATFPPGPPASPTGKAHSNSKYQGLGTKNLPSTMKGASGGAGTKRRVSVGNEGVLTAPLMMPLQHVTNTNASGLMARRRVMAANKAGNQNGDKQQ